MGSIEKKRRATGGKEALRKKLGLDWKVREEGTWTGRMKRGH